MNTLKVEAHQEVQIVMNGARWFIVYDNDGNAHTFHNTTILAEHGIHQISTSGGGSGNCEFLPGKRCNYDGRSTGRLYNENEIFALLQSAAYNAEK